MNVLRTSKIGESGEQLACDFLETRGHHILDRNWHSGHLELDIVSEGPDGLHFVEVKARTAPVMSTVLDQVTWSSKSALRPPPPNTLPKSTLQEKRSILT